MAIDKKGAIIGGIVGGPAGALIGGSGMFGKGPSIPKYDPTYAQNLATSGKQEEERFISNYGAGVGANENKFQTGVNTATGAAQAQSQGAAQDYLQNFDPITSRIVQNRTDALKRQTFGAIPELVQAAREAGAAGGGLDRGVTQNAIASVPMEQARQFNEGASNIQNTALQGQLDARSKVYDSSNQLILSKLGIDANAAESILNSGNQALIQQLNDLIDNSRNSIGIQISADNAAQGSAIGAATNEASNKQAILNGLLGIGGTVAGAAVGGPAGAVIGGQLAKKTSPFITSTGTNASQIQSA